MTIRKTDAPAVRPEPKTPPSPSAATPAPVISTAAGPNVVAPASDAYVRSGQPALSLTGAPRADAVAITASSPRRAHQPAFGTAAFEERLDALTGSKVRDGNRISLLFDGVNSFAERNRLIEGARSSIHLQTFIFTDDDTGWDLARRLSAKAQEGVKVRVIYDALGSNRSDDKLFDYMRQHGVELRAYGDPLKQFWDVNDRWHEKHLIVDGNVSIEGGMNIADEYAYGGSGRMVVSRGQAASEPWRDADARLEGPAVADAQEAFLKNWKELGPPVADAERAALFPELSTRGTAKVRVVQHRPDEEGDNNTHALYLEAIRSARESVTIENAYFIPPQDLREALIDAAKRGVNVQIMTNSRASNDMGIVSDAARYFYDDLIAAGVRIHEKQGGTLHTKTATFDGVFSIVGSVNLNGRSKGRDSEVALAIEDPIAAAQLQRRFHEGLGQTKEVTSQELRKEDFFTNLKQWSLSLLAWTF